MYKNKKSLRVKICVGWNERINSSNNFKCPNNYNVGNVWKCNEYEGQYNIDGYRITSLV